MMRQALLSRVVNPQMLSKRFSHPDMFTHVEKFPAAAKVKFRSVPESEQGFYEPYRSDFTRDTRYTEGALPGMHAQTTGRFFKVTLRRNKELYPLFAAIAIWFVGFCYVVYWSFSKREVVINRTSKINCTDWSKERNHYNKWNMTFDGRMKNIRIPELETLQDEMLAAAKARGTR